MHAGGLQFAEIGSAKMCGGTDRIVKEPDCDAIPRLGNHDVLEGVRDFVAPPQMKYWW